MATNYKINGTDIEDIFESFTLAEQQEGGVTDSKFSDGSGRFKQNGADLKTALGKTFPTSAGSYIGGANSTTEYTAQGAAIDVALKGCRPIGILRSTLGVGTWYINRVNGRPGCHPLQTRQAERALTTTRSSSFWNCKVAEAAVQALL